MKNYKWNTYLVGIVVGLLLPALFMLAYAHTIGIFRLWETGMFDMLKPVFGRMLLLSAFADMAFVFVLYELNAWKCAKGMIIAIFPYLIAGMIFIG